jgi:hypothetical protein
MEGTKKREKEETSQALSLDRKTDTLGKESCDRKIIRHIKINLE